MSVAWVALVVSVACLGFLTVAAVRVGRMLRDLHAAVDALHREAVPLIADMHQMVERAAGDLDRVEDLLDTADDLRESAGRIGATIETAATFTSSPLLRLAGLLAGFRRRRPDS
ncbi:MAG: hypothetical protein P6D49_05775 [Acidimicrobiales bacterium]|nr:hypothetical protein [Acidimicrobiales bacterium]